MNKEKLISLGKKILKISSDQDLAVYAGNATLYIMMSLIPMLMVIIAGVSLMPWFTSSDFQNLLFSYLPDVQEIRNLISNIIANLSEQSSSTVASVSALTSLWSASNGISAIQKGLKKMNRVPSFGFKDKIFAVIYTFLFAIQLLSLLLFQVLGSTFKEIMASFSSDFFLFKYVGTISTVINSSGAVTIVISLLILVLTYTYLPGGKRSMKSQLPGAVLTSIIWAAFSLFFSFFIPRFWKASSLYGSLASVFLVAMWLQTMMTILFYGAALNTVLEEEKQRS
ncbi:MAG: YihY/virulence factor BrkB family protein [Solobacterium sp.]|nr:YihY/virulence factor BrkB family protein [Solobacterium sp.]MCR5449505.1 YihY/virulence factor BrkB family protein [Solobacterium sp.]